MRIIDIESKLDVANYTYAFLNTDILEKVRCSIATNNSTPIIYDGCVPNFESLSVSLRDNNYRVLCTGVIKGKDNITITLAYISDALSLFVYDAEASKYEHIILSELQRLKTQQTNM